MNVGNFTATVPVHTHIARESDSAARVRSLAASGAISTTSLWQNVGAVAVNSWQAFAAHELIIAANLKASATKAVTKADADLLVVTEAEALAASDKAQKDMSDAELTTAVKFVYVAEPEQPVTRTSIKGKGGKADFLSGLNPPWCALVADTRLACLAAVTAARTAMEEAEAAEPAAFANNPPPAPASIAPGPDTAAAIDLSNLGAAEMRALLARIVDEQP